MLTIEEYVLLELIGISDEELSAIRKIVSFTLLDKWNVLLIF